MTTISRLQRPRGDEGAYAILYAITIVIAIAFAGIVVDINSARADRRLNRSASDAAALAAATKLRADAPNPRQACESAIAYLNDNLPELRGLAASACVPFPVSGFPCPPTPKSPIVVSPPGLHGFGVTLTWPVSDGSPLLRNPDIAPGGETQAGDPEFDGTDQCQRFAVEVAQQRDFLFGPAVGGPGGITTSATSVARASPQGESGEAAAALILLERTHCEVLHLPNNNPTVVVQGHGDRPGIIHADSKGNGSNCGGSKIFHVQQNAPNKIVAAHAETGTATKAQGIIGVVALHGATNGNVYSGSPAEGRVRAQADPSAAPPVPDAQQVPTGRALVSRALVDRRYRAAVESAVSAAQDAWDMTPADAAAAGFSVMNTCALNDTAPNTDAKVFVNCSGGDITVGQYSFDGPNSVVVMNRPVSLVPGNILRVTDARKVLIRGSLDNSGEVHINAGSATNCADRHQAAPARTATLILKGGLGSTNSASYLLCGTTVLLADCAIPSSDGTPPTDNTCSDNLRMTGGAINWSPPNAVSGPAGPADFAKFEDLALWGEADGGPSRAMSVNGNGSSRLSGIYFLPNARPLILSGATGMNVVNAQLVVRRLRVGGNAIFTFRPNPNDAITMPYFGSVLLIR